MQHGIATLADIDEFDEIIDVRSPAEFADDHIPGAINCPVLDDAQRARVGRIYVQISPFEANKIGAVLVAENIARHLQERFLNRAKDWRPLIYCWRGGKRSGAMTTIFRAIGWRAGQLDGGYKTYRRHIIDTLETLPTQFAFRLLCGPTGSGKTRVLQALAARGEQVLDLEALASHKGSVLGVVPDQPQPSQKSFESALATTLQRFDRLRPVYVEAEGRKIGQLRITDHLLAGLRTGECWTITAPLEARVEFLLRDYHYWLDQPDWLKQRLQSLHDMHSRQTLADWFDFIDQRQWSRLVSELLSKHYDPLYQRSQAQHFRALPAANILSLDGFDDGDIANLIDKMLATPPLQRG